MEKKRANVGVKVGVVRVVGGTVFIERIAASVDVISLELVG